MIGRMHRTAANRIFAALSAVVAGSVLVGASSYEWAPIGKADRPASIADCRLAKMSESDFCRGVVLPKTSTDKVEIAPGLTLLQISEG